MSVKNCLPLVSLLIAGLCTFGHTTSVPKPVLHAPSHCVAKTATVSVTGTGISSIEYKGQREPSHFNVSLKRGAHEIIHVTVVTKKGHRYVLDANVCRRQH